ncbi:unnamed protein product [Sphagnum balticum]
MVEEQITELTDIAFLTVDIPSHTYPLLGYLAELKKHGYNFDFYGSKNHAEKTFAGLGANSFGFEELGMKQCDDPLHTCLFSSCLTVVPKIEAIWEERKKKPKLILADSFSIYALPLRKRHKIPVLVLYTSFFNPKDLEVVPDPWKTWLKNPLLEFKEPRDKIEATYGITFNRHNDVFILGDKNISTYPSFWGEALSPVGDNCYYLGPGFRDTDEKEKKDFDIAEIKDKELVFISLGTALTNFSNFFVYDNAVEGLKRTDYNVLITASLGKADELLAKEVPKNISIKSWVPQIEVLDHTKVFLSHMGAGGVSEALYKGVPMIAVPGFADQFASALVLEKLNLGRYLRDKSPESLQKLVKEVFESEEIQANAKKYKELINPQESRNKFVEIVKSMLTEEFKIE